VARTLRKQSPELPVLVLHAEEPGRFAASALEAALAAAIGKPAARARIHLRSIAAEGTAGGTLSDAIAGAWQAGLGLPFASTAATHPLAA
jgi:hypothetical protein